MLGWGAILSCTRCCSVWLCCYFVRLVWVVVSSIWGCCNGIVTWGMGKVTIGVVGVVMGW